MERLAYHRFLGPRLPVRPNARLAWAGVALACLAVLGIARYLQPDPRGFGTHQQLSIYKYPCGFVLTSGLPCPTCGMTTAFSMIMHGRPFSALKAQPAGAILCVATVGLLAFSLYVAISGRIVSLNWERIGPVRIMIALGLLILGGWAFKIAHGLITGTLPAN
jgi:hypothetical protein